MKFYCTRQHDIKDCGAACLATICKDYGVNRPLAFFRNITNTDANGVNILGIVDAGRKLGFETDAYQVNSIEELINNEKIVFPFIARIINEHNLYHYIVVNRINKHIYVSDPGKGKIKYTLETFNTIFTGYIITFSPSDALNKNKIQSETGIFLKDICLSNIGVLFILCILALFISGLGIIFSYGIRYEFETLEAQEQLFSSFDDIDLHYLEEEHLNGNLSEEEFSSIYYVAENVLWLHDNIHQLILLLIVVITSKTILDYIRQRIIVNLTMKFDKKVLLRVTDKILKLPQENLENWKSGDLIMRYTDAETVSYGIISSTLSLIVDTIMAIAGGIVLYSQNALLFSIVCVLVLFYIFIMLKFINPIRNVNISKLEAQTNQSTTIKETVDGIFDFKVFANEYYANHCVASKIEDNIKCYKKARKVELKQNLLIELTTGFSTILLLFFSFFLISEGSLTIGTFIAFMSLMDFFISPIENLVGLQGTIQNSIVSANRLSDLLDDKSEVHTGKIDFCATKEIKLSNITFNYGNQLPILENVTMSFPVGKHTVILGNNGTGKSTLTKLLVGLYLPKEGNIYIDGIDYRDYDIKSIRSSIIYLNQNPNIMSKTICENICFGLDNIEDANFQQVAKITGIDIFVNKLPSTYNYVLEEQGRNLSTGQRQRIALSRALLRNPAVLILDEATSNIDENSQKEIFESIREYYPNITLITIMHNMSSIIKADHYINMNCISSHPNFSNN